MLEHDHSGTNKHFRIKIMSIISLTSEVNYIQLELNKGMALIIV